MLRRGPKTILGCLFSPIMPYSVLDHLPCPECQSYTGLFLVNSVAQQKYYHHLNVCQHIDFLHVLFFSGASLPWEFILVVVPSNCDSRSFLMASLCRLCSMLSKLTLMTVEKVLDIHINDQNSLSQL